jgi:predicted RNA-binding Zn ribbon-like protein
MKGKERRIHELTESAQSMVHGSLSEVTRQCGDPSCACAHDPARRHGPHLYLKFASEGKAHSVYVPPEQGAALKTAHRAWLRFQEVGAEVAADNREQFLRTLQQEKQRAKARRAKLRGKAK